MSNGDEIRPEDIPRSAWDIPVDQMSDDFWWIVVQHVCKERGHPQSFYADRAEWLEQKHKHKRLPADAVDEKARQRN